MEHYIEECAQQKVQELLVRSEMEHQLSELRSRLQNRADIRSTTTHVLDSHTIGGIDTDDFTLGKLPLHSSITDGLTQLTTNISNVGKRLIGKGALPGESFTLGGREQGDRSYLDGNSAMPSLSTPVTDLDWLQVTQHVSQHFCFYFLLVFMIGLAARATRPDPV